MALSSEGFGNLDYIPDSNFGGKNVEKYDKQKLKK